MSKTYHIVSDTVAHAWEELVLAVWNHGIKVPKYGIELTTLVEITDPFKEPRIHRGDTLCAIRSEIDKYTDEILKGTRDQHIGTTSVDYTYHDRLFYYKQYSKKTIWGQINPYFTNQIEYIIKRLKSEPEHNGIQAITWRMEDQTELHAPCLQRIWCKVYDGKVDLHATWRSRDCFRAWHMNVLGITMLQKYIADESGYKVGKYIDFCNSVHIYESCFEQVARWVKVIEKRKKGK